MNKKYKQNFLYVGTLAKQVRDYGKSLIQKGASYQNVIEKINQKIKELGAIPAFPPQMALNDTAAHFLLEPGQEIIFSDEIIKLDIGVCYGGAIGDCAVTIDLSGKHQKLIDAVEEALLRAEQSIKVGQKLREIGKIIDQTISSYGFQSVKNLAGHGLAAYQIHTPPTIPNYEDSSKGIIRPGMTFAIEPFATDGKGVIYEKGVPTIFSQIGKHLPKSEVSHLLMEKIKTFNRLPFAIHDLLNDNLSLEQVKKGLVELMSAKIIISYGPLIEENHGMVAQAENSVLVDETGQVIITTR